MRLKLAVFFDGKEWLVVTANKNDRTGWYDALPVTEQVVSDHAEFSTLRDIPRTYNRMNDKDKWPWFVHYWAHVEQGETKENARVLANLATDKEKF